ncbi:hypothetical protein [Tateyamaria sp. SN6-1]|uniref:hypothetical protein n=1 Tax=Tateyamaria sp. SN6-1 TaxID=3092148 RepID=UPI0039F4D3DC
MIKPASLGYASLSVTRATTLYSLCALALFFGMITLDERVLSSTSPLVRGPVWGIFALFSLTMFSRLFLTISKFFGASGRTKMALRVADLEEKLGLP